MFCNSCGTPLPDDSVFCNKCGNRLGAAPVRSSGMTIKGSLVKKPEPAESAPQPYIPPEPIPAYNPQPNIPVYSAPEIIPAYSEAPVIPHPVKEKKNLTWLWIILAVVAVAGIIGILFATGVLGGTKYAFAETIEYHSGNGSSTSYTIDVEFNDDGFPETLTKTYNDSSTYSEITELSYDSKNNLICKYIYILNSDGSRNDRQTKEYNEYGDVIKDVSTYHDGSVTTREYARSYDRKGNLLECTTTVDGTETLRQVWEYDKDGNVIEYTNYSDGEKSARYEYEYDKQGNTVSSKYTDYIRSEYSSEYTYKNEYDGKLLVETVRYRDDEKYATTTYEYDEKDRLTEEKIKYTDGSQYRYEYEYDSDGNMIESSCSGDYSYRYEYEYDSKGNMVEEAYYHDGEFNYRKEYSYSSKFWKLSDSQKLLFEELDLIFVQEEL